MPRVRNVSGKGPERTNGTLRQVVGVSSQADKLILDQLDCDVCGMEGQDVLLMQQFPIDLRINRYDTKAARKTGGQACQGATSSASR